MKVIFLKSTIFVLFFLFANGASAQFLRSLSLPKRDCVLISISKKVLEKKAPEYLLEYVKPVIMKKVIHFKSKKDELEEPKASPFYGTKNGQVYYIVEFPQDESIEFFEEGFVAQVYIWEDNSKPWLLYLGNGMIENIE